MDDGFIISGVIYNESFNNSYPWLLKLDKLEQEQWNKTYISQDIKSISIYDALQTNDGGYAIIGSKKDYSHFYSYGCMIKTDKDGNQEWINEYPTIFGYNKPYSFYQTSDGGFILTGETLNIFKFNMYTFKGVLGLWLAKTDKYGEIQWSHFCGKKNAGFQATLCGGTSVLQISDGSYIVLGNSMLYGYDENFILYIWLFKTDKNGLTAKTRNYQVNDLMNYRFLERFPILQQLHSRLGPKKTADVLRSAFLSNS